MRMADPDTHNDLFTVATTYDGSTYTANSVGLDMVDPSHTYRFYVACQPNAVWLRLGNNGGYNYPFAVTIDAGGPRVEMDGHTLRVQQMTINGTSYYVLAGTS